MITLAELKQYLKINDTTQDSFLQTCVDTAINAVIQYCNRDFRLASYTQYFQGNGKNRLFLKNYPINSVSEIKKLDTTTYNYIDIITNAGDTIGNSTQLHGDGSLVLLKDYTFESGSEKVENIKILYNGGYAAAPDDIKTVCKEIATEYYNNAPAGLGRLGKGSENIGGQSSKGSTYDPESVIKRHENVLNKYLNANI